ncbi:hypothetical protein ACJIZ3_013963 [Penstemon smallii]|uniref:Uncharacterized protein n=1 Tax=Penstemon smallii TaxID=265156 RepID=A0ABD3RID6_9LAMI
MENKNNTQVVSLARDNDVYKERMAAVIRITRATKFVKEDTIPCKIEEDLYLGSLGSANNKSALKSLNVTHILTVANSLPVAHPNDFKYKIIEVCDRSDVTLLPFFDECFAFIEEARTTGGAVLVHCFAGRSRSVTIIVAYLMFKNGMSLSKAMEHVKGKRPVVSPNSGFMLQLADYERYLREHAISLTIANRAQKMMEMSRISGKAPGSNHASCPQAPQNPSGGSNHPNRARTGPSSQVSNSVRNITDPSTQNQARGPVQSYQPNGSQRSTHSRETDSSTPESTRANKRPRDENEAATRCPGKENVLEVSSFDEDIMNFDHPRAGRVSNDASMIDSESGRDAWKVFQATIFKKDQIKLSKKMIKQGLKSGARHLISANQIMYHGYLRAERALKDLDTMKKKLKEQMHLAKTYAASSKEAEKRKKNVEDELQRKDDQLIDTIKKLSARNAEMETLQKKTEDMNAEIERLKLESRESYSRGLAEGLSMSTIPSREQRLAIAREFYRSPVFDALSDMKAGGELFNVFDKCWKQCKKLGFLNERFDENALDPLKNEDCEPYPIDDSAGGVDPEQDEFAPIYLEELATGSVQEDVEQQQIKPVVDEHQEQP